MQDLNTRATTTYLKGIAITGVVVGHTLFHYVPGSLSKTAGLENCMVAIFFVLSGFGIYHSLEKSLSHSEGKKRALAVYFKNRAWRIYPLFWLSLFLTPFFVQQFVGWHDFSPGLVIKYLGFAPFIDEYPKPADFMWFIHALIPCYLLAPILYLLLKYLRPAKFLAVNLLFMLLFGFLSIWVLGHTGVLPVQTFVYRSFIFGNIFLFAIGMSISPLFSILKHVFRNRLQGYLLVGLSLVLFTGSLRYSRTQDILFANSGTYLAPIFFISVFILCLTVIALNPILPFRSLFSFFGTHSYSIYLFHIPFWGLLSSLGIVYSFSQTSDAQAGNVPMTLLLLLPFFAFCALLDAMQNRSGDIFRNWRNLMGAYPSKLVPQEINADEENLIQGDKSS
ncbi:MAG: acyltransferase [Actinobacteria bacterium]|nr:acyltransferase [Actinomycetota bacterium]